MLDPFTALGVAGNIVQFVDFTAKLISKGREIYESAEGASVEHLDLEAIANNLSRLTERLQKDLQQHLLPPIDEGLPLSETKENRAELQLGSINSKCSREADALLSILRDLKVDGEHKKWKSFRLALMTVWKEDQIKGVVSRLSEYRKDLDTELLFSLRTTLDASSQQQLESFLKVDNNTKGIAKELGMIRQDNKRSQQEVLQAIKECQWQSYNREHVAMFSFTMDHVVEEERIAALRAKFLHRLSFLAMTDREEEIAEAHQATFRWLYTAPENQLWDNFTDWLKKGDGVYWVTGKAGSGKSTLMKYIYQNDATLQLLRVWAGKLPLIAASYYFWNPGTPMQKSQMGLFQSLLYKCLSQCQNLIPQIFPYRWRSYDIFGDDLRPWTRTELMQAFNRLIEQDGVSAKFCFFIDGLDEFDGDHGTIVDLFKRVVSSSSVKACVSSRPLLIFEDGFQLSAKLRLHNLTGKDIKLYTNAQLEQNERFIALKKREPKLAPHLITEIVDKSAGVFLWVTLVVRSLLTGLQNSDRISDLQRRLKELPADLEDLFQVIMRKIEPFYEQQASHLFQIVHNARLPLSLLGVSFADEEDGNFALSARMPLDKNDITFKYQETARRLNSRCMGLIEVRCNQESDLLPSSKVDYLHRTVKDFLDRPDIWQRILSQSSQEFNVNEALMQSYLLQSKWQYSDFNEQAWKSLSGEFMEFAGRAGESLRGTQSSYVDEFYETATRLWQVKKLDSEKKGRPLGWVRFVPSPCPHGSFFHHAVWYGLQFYVQYKLEQDSNAGTCHLDPSTLSCAIVHRPEEIWQLTHRNTRVVALLLEYGADPNGEIEGRSVWISVLSFLDKALQRRDMVQYQNKNCQLPIADIVRLLLEAGADPEACILSTLPAIAVIDDFEKIFPKQATGLRDLIQQKLQEKVGISCAVKIEQGGKMLSLERREELRQKRMPEEVGTVIKEIRVTDSVLIQPINAWSTARTSLKKLMFWKFRRRSKVKSERLN